MKEEKSVNLIECFRSFQGEGPDSGKGMYILRFKTCNRNCHWCDTIVKMRISMEAEYKLSHIQKMLINHSSGILITGGEPTVPKHFDETVMLLNELEYPIANVETNGYNIDKLIEVSNPNKPIKFIFSPKFFNENDEYENYDILQKIASNKNVYVKLVYESDNKKFLKFLSFFEDGFQNIIQEQRAWLMPKGDNPEELLKNSGEVFDVCEKYNFNFSSRSHIIFGFI